MTYFNLNDTTETKIPALGLGTWQLTGTEATEATNIALDIGYRHIDTADYYRNHTALADSLANTDISRDQLFLTSKVWYDRQDYQQTKDDVARFLNELNLDYLDLVLIHWPNKDIEISEPLRAFQELIAEGNIKNYGVSNFTKSHLEEVFATIESENMEHQPVTNQVELHPHFQQKQLRDFCEQHKVLVTAYSPLGRGSVLNNPVLTKIANDHDATTGQVTLAWLRQSGIVAIPKSKSRDHLQENFDSLEIELNTSEIEQIKTDINQSGRMIHPNFAEFE